MFNDLTSVACPSLDTTNAVCVPAGQRCFIFAGQDEDVALPSQKWPLLAFKLERCIGEPG